MIMKMYIVPEVVFLADPKIKVAALSHPLLDAFAIDLFDGVLLLRATKRHWGSQHSGSYQNTSSMCYQQQLEWCRASATRSFWQIAQDAVLMP